MRVGWLLAVEPHPELAPVSRAARHAARRRHRRGPARRRVPRLGSVTGAPKVRACEVIADCEGRERGLFTGAVGG
ncbi:hypothetical protein HBB16_20045 [Pseudonocardia sp. MCCB 268]|nr:hypothetical protein [Pseudonocardia cytotoxica]